MSYRPCPAGAVAAFLWNCADCYICHSFFGQVCVAGGLTPSCDGVGVQPTVAHNVEARDCCGHICHM